MGAYENPVTVVDTQSGQIWANAIQNLGAQTSKVLDQERDRLLEENKDFSIRLRKIQEDGIKNYDIIAGSLAEKGVTDQQIYNQAQKFQTEKTNASTKLMQTGRPPEELAEAQKQYNQSDTALKGLVPYIKARGESLEDYLEEVGGNPVNVGQQGYASMTENQDFQIGTWIDSGYLKGSKEIVYDKEKGWGTKYKESEDIDTKYDGKEFTIWGTQAADYTTTKVPFVDKGLESVLLETGIIDKNGKLTESYQYYGPQTRTETTPDGSITAVIVGPNWERAAIAIDKKVNDIAGGYLKVPSIANAVWRNVFGEKEDMKIVDGGGVDPEQAKIFTEKLKLRAGQYIPNVDYVASDDPKAAKWIQENPGAFENKSFGQTKPKPQIDYSNLSPKQGAIEVYNEIARDPLSAYNRYNQGPGEKAKVLSGTEESIIVVPKFDKTTGEPITPVRYNMDLKADRAIFFQEIFDVSNLVGKDDKGRGVRLQFPKIVDEMSDKYITNKTAAELIAKYKTGKE
tara:strand:+ start:1056 stop:2591 length:1536 start_codon:yes stop_codon:yes gene_type:complete